MPPTIEHVILKSCDRLMLNMCLDCDGTLHIDLMKNWEYGVWEIRVKCKGCYNELIVPITDKEDASFLDQKWRTHGLIKQEDFDNVKKSFLCKYNLVIIGEWLYPNDRKRPLKELSEPRRHPDRFEKWG